MYPTKKTIGASVLILSQITCLLSSEIRLENSEGNLRARYPIAPRIQPDRDDHLIVGGDGKISVDDKLIFPARHSQPKTDVSRNQIPIWLLNDVSNVDSAAEFMKKFLTTGDGTSAKGPTRRRPLLPELGEHSKKVGGVVARTGRPNPSPVNPTSVAKPAACEPAPTIVQLVKKAVDPDVLYYPTCTRIMKCGGCCQSPVLECQPIEKNTLKLTIIRSRYRTGRSNFAYEAMESVTVEEHKRCKCQCKVKASDCTSKHNYNPSLCRCVCKNAQETKRCRGTDKFWDSSKCLCRCKNYQDQCSTGRYFDEKLCRCVPLAASRTGLPSNEPDWLFGRTGTRHRQLAKLPGLDSAEVNFQK